MDRNYAIGAAAAALILASACSKPPAEAQAKGPAVASFGSGQITADQFKAKLAELPPMVQARYAPLERRKEFLDNMVRTELLVAEGRSRGLDKDPEVRATLDRIIAQKVMKLEAEEFDKKNPVTDDEIKAFYESHKNEFVRAERIRVSHILFGAKSGGAPRERLKSEAEKGLAEVKAKEAGPNKTAFGALARSRSDDEASKSLEGDLGFHSKEELAGLWGPAVADAAFSLKSVNDLSGAVESEKGIHLLKLTARQPGFEQSLESAKGRIQARVLQEKRREYSEKFLAELKTKHNVVVHEDVLKSVEMPSNSPAAPPGFPPGALPAAPPGSSPAPAAAPAAKSP